MHYASSWAQSLPSNTCVASTTRGVGPLVRRLPNSYQPGSSERYPTPTGLLILFLLKEDWEMEIVC